MSPTNRARSSSMPSGTARRFQSAYGTRTSSAWAPPSEPPNGHTNDGVVGILDGGVWHVGHRHLADVLVDDCLHPSPGPVTSLTQTSAPPTSRRRIRSALSGPDSRARWRP